jgi:ABC-type transport system involved in cytochrome c biogenesis ATPase subunit
LLSFKDLAFELSFGARTFIQGNNGHYKTR